ncbi:fatty acid synthase-like [Plakobranchus ocellatus]|uniref:Fatty acid synthase n=1 Tax=Plakobranchus ocellatus TaxID=259542 RepID=A0AAV4DTG8_9GAST|nr:fatty acid synthase-like [Plakobranchus ocellatus]
MPGRMHYADIDFLAPENEVVISGMSGRFSESANLDEFYENLINHIDMITDDERRFPRGYNDIHISGKLKEIDKFDNQFFGQTAKYVEVMCPEMRMGMECAYEAIVDAGLSLELLRETRTGVYITNTIMDSYQAHHQDVHSMKGNVYIGNTNVMIASKIAFALGLNGPAVSLDTACSSSLFAMDAALRAIRTGVIDQAIVGGITCHLNPFQSGDFNVMPTLSQTHRRCKSFDASGDGFTRAEGGSYFLLQKKEDCRRSYGRIIHIRTNTDGKSETGFLAPWGWRHYEMLRDAYTEAKIDPRELSYLECHGTGTRVGDPQEILGLTTNNFVTKGRNKEWPLLIGSVKSNCGHCECASGSCSMTKILLSIKYGMIPANLHYKTPNPNIPALLDGTVKVVAENTPYDGGYIGINSFGLGGANAHVIIGDTDTRHHKNSPAGKEPRLFIYAARTQEGVNQILDFALQHSQSLELQALLTPSACTETYKMPVRCYAVLNGSKEIQETQVR